MSNSPLFKKNTLAVAEMNQAEIYQYATDASSIVSITDENGIIIHVNERFCEISGYTESELLGKNHRIVNSGKHSKEFFKEMWDTLLSGRGWRGDVCNISKCGKVYWVDTKVIPIWNKEGKNFQYISIRSDITENKRYEALVKQEKETLDLVLESSRATMFQVNVNTNYLKCGRNFFAILGFSPQEINNDFDNFLSAIDNEDVEQFTKLLDDHLQGKNQEFNTLAKLINSSGNVLHILCRGRVVKRDEAGNALEFLGVITDLSEQLGLESLLKRTQEAAQVGSWSYNVKTDELLWSPLVYQIHGRSSLNFKPSLEEAIEFYVPEHRDLITSVVEEAFLNGSAWDLELKIIHSNEREVWVRAVGQCDLIDGEPVSLYGTFQDIDARKQAELDLSASKQQLDLALEATGIGIWEYYPQEDKLVWDEYMFQLFDVPQESFEGKFSCWQKCLLPEDLKETTAVFTNCIEQRENIYNASFRIKVDPGSIKYIQGRAKIEYDELGSPIKILGLNWDISKDKEFQSYLIEARDKAEDATKAKSAFLASMSHEIRTPMNGVLGMLELLSETKLDEDQRELVTTIKSCSDNLLNIVNDVLDFSKIEAGKIQIEDRAFDLTELLNQLKMIFEIAAHKKGIDIVFELESDFPDYIVTDMVRLKQVLTNLLSNALKFTNEGSITLKAKMSDVHYDSKKNQLEFSVRDTGIGIPEDKLDKLFLSFSQVDDSTTRRFGGSGLGLAISKSFVERMGGNILVESTKEIGSVFSFSILVGIEEKKVSTNSPTPVHYDYARDISVLVAEDNITNQKLAIRFFKKIGVAMSIAADGIEVLEMVAKNNYDIIFMDVQMPNKDGLTATKELIQIYGDAAPKIVAMTANVFKEDQQKCYSAGMIDFLGKPIARKNITAILSKYFPNKCHTQTHKNKEVFMDHLIDEKKIMFEFSEDFDIFCELVDDYKVGQIQMIDDIEKAIEAKDYDALRIAAHTLKGVSSNFYSKSLTHLVFELEKSGESQNIDMAVKSFSQLRECNEKVMNELDDFIKSNASLLDSEVA